MKILLHICCAPCTIYPLEILRKEAGQIKGVFFNPNIHPYLEYKKRLDTVREYTAREGLEVAVAEGYPIEDFLQKTAFLGKDRCSYCYEVRLRHTAAAGPKGALRRLHDDPALQPLPEARSDPRRRQRQSPGK